MIGWIVKAKTGHGCNMLLDTYGKPTRKEKIMTRIEKISEDPVEFKVLFKNQRVAGLLASVPDEMERTVYKSFAKHDNSNITNIKKHLKVKII